MTTQETYGELVARYEALYRGSRPVRAKGLAGTWGVPALVALCERLELLATNEYLRCMWARRKHLHATGQHGRVYDGTDAVKWARAVRRQGEGAA